MTSLEKLKKQIENVNAVGLENLGKKGLGIVSGGVRPLTTLDIMCAIEDIPSGIPEGREEERRIFWDAFTNNNSIRDYTSAFQNLPSARKWNKTTFNPPYRLVPTDCNYMFEYFGEYHNLTPVTLDTVDFSGCTIVTKTFSNSCVSPIVVDFSNATSMRYTFESSNGGNMPDTTVKVTDKLKDATNAFMHNIYGARFTDDSVIACNMSFAQSSKLSLSALHSIVNALAVVESPYTITFHPSIEISDSQKQVIADKGWTLVQ